MRVRFTTRISETRNIQVPFDNYLYDKEVDVIIKPGKRKLNFIINLIQVVDVFRIDKEVILNAIASDMKDFEDAVQESATKRNCPHGEPKSTLTNLMINFVFMWQQC